MDLIEVFKDSEDLAQYDAGTVVLREGEPGDHMYVVMEGELSIRIAGRTIATASAKAKTLPGTMMRAHPMKKPRPQT